MAFLGPKRGNGFSIFLEMFFSELKNSNLFFLRLDFLQKYRKNDDFDLKREKSKTRFLGTWVGQEVAISASAQLCRTSLYGDAFLDSCLVGVISRGRGLCWVDAQWSRVGYHVA